MDLERLLKVVVEKGASDLILKEASRPSIRLAGKIQFLTADSISSEFMNKVIEEICPPRAKEIFQTRGEFDLAYELYGIGRFRVNIFKQRGRTSAALRYVKTDIPSFEELNLPSQILMALCELKRGLILITGTAGSGKSTTIASMINHMNNTQNKHIVTVEDPIEFIFSDNNCIINQREVGLDTSDFVTALKYVLRQSPDVIMIGEMRDRETMEAAISAAETGHLVLSTLHTINAQQTVERIINYFPPHQHDLLRLQMAMVLEAVISQRLLPTKDGKTLIPALEIMRATPTIRELLHDGKTRELSKAIAEGKYFGTCTFNQSLRDLVKNDLVTLEDALATADSPDELRIELRGITKGTKAGDFDFKF